MKPTKQPAAEQKRVFRLIEPDELDARAEAFGRLLLDALLRAAD